MAKASVIGVIRPPFLLLTPICVLLGIAVAVWEGNSIDVLDMILVLAGALSAHISVNALNEYFDFKSGLDFRTIKTPFSGGSGTLVAQPDLVESALMIGVGTLVLTSGIGIYFLLERGWGLLPLGLAGVVIIATYTQWINHNRYLCLIAPGVGFGPLMVIGTCYALTGTYSATAALSSLIPFFLVSNLLLLNQFPDIEADRSIGRDNFPIAIGPSGSARIYGFFALGAFAVIPAGVLAGLMPIQTLFALLTLVFAWHAWQGASGQAVERVEAFIPHMRSNVILTLSTPLILALGFFIG